MIQYNSRLTFKRIILIPLILALCFVCLLAYQYTQKLSENVESEYNRVTQDLTHSVKLLGSLNYSFATYFIRKSAWLPSKSAYNKGIDQDGLCLWVPSNETIESAYRSDARKVLEIDYAVKALPEACQPNSPIYNDILNKLLLAPTFSFLNGIEDYISGLYYVSPLGYIISSPADLVTNIHESAIPIMQTRQYWLEAQEGKSVIRLTGPVTDVATNKLVLTISAGLFDKNKFEGVVLVDIIISKLVSNHALLDQHITFQALGKDPLPDNAWLPRTVLIDGVETNQIMYFEFDWKKEIHLFFVREKIPLLGILVLYFLTVVSLIYWRARDEKHHFHTLALRDPMTGLLNRRGFYQEYSLKVPLLFESITVFDIDNFKKINDTHGHDVGDDVIIFVGNTLKAITRNDDIVARFGGEEFMVYIQSEAIDTMIAAVERICKEIESGSLAVIPSGFTVSGGIAIQDKKRTLGLGALIKQADEKLYRAKETGKNKVIY